jgi:hypothetical protein
MANSKQPLHTTAAIIIFILAACIDWSYVLWVKAQPIINNAWFVITPLIAYFYFTFAFIASVLIYSGKRLGLSIAYCVLLFGTAADVLSYSLIYQKNAFIAFMILPLIILNFIAVFYLVYHQSGFAND